ncbi:hypothetical protein EJ576_01080 [Pseudomonas sp. C 49-2]|nr:hypothetical protein EJ576_01080 [Pseudomonas sp. C 49-2]
MSDAGPCGSWLACDAGGAVFQSNRGDAIAGKPAPTGGRVSCPTLCIFRAGGYESTPPTS